MGFVGSAGARVCPNLPQRRSGPRSAVRRGAEYQRFFSCASARSGSLWQIWTNWGRRGPSGEDGRPLRRGPRRRRRRGCRRGGRSRTGRTPRSAAPAPPERRPTRAQAPRPPARRSSRKNRGRAGRTRGWARPPGTDPGAGAPSHAPLRVIMPIPVSGPPPPASPRRESHGPAGLRACETLTGPARPPRAHCAPCPRHATPRRRT